MPLLGTMDCREYDPAIRAFRHMRKNARVSGRGQRLVTRVHHDNNTPERAELAAWKYSSGHPSELPHGAPNRRGDAGRLNPEGIRNLP